MSLEKIKAHLKEYKLDQNIMKFTNSSAKFNKHTLSKMDRCVQ